MQYLFWLVVLLAGFTLPVSALEKKDIRDVDLNKLILETQASETKLSETDNGIHLVWWVPTEYWEAALSNQRLSPEQKKQAIDLLKPYAIFGIVQANVSPSGAFEFYSKNQIAQNLTIKRLKTDSNKVMELDPNQDISNDVASFFSQVKPILTAAMGEMGKNFHFFFVEDNAKERILSPYESGQILVELSNSSGAKITPLVLETPLNSLYVPRICPNGKEAEVSWQFCPWDGTKLSE